MKVAKQAEAEAENDLEKYSDLLAMFECDMKMYGMNVPYYKRAEPVDSSLVRTDSDVSG
jgi:hypothetical protein